jgi:hypothetical protein
VTLCNRLESGLVAAALAIGGIASASVPTEPTRIAQNARASIALDGTRLAWKRTRVS